MPNVKLIGAIHTVCPSLIDLPIIFELSCAQTHGHTARHTHTHRQALNKSDACVLITGQYETKLTSLGGFEPPTFRLTAERANRLRHRDVHSELTRFS